MGGARAFGQARKLLFVGSLLFMGSPPVPSGTQLGPQKGGVLHPRRGFHSSACVFGAEGITALLIRVPPEGRPQEVRMCRLFLQMVGQQFKRF